MQKPCETIGLFATTQVSFSSSAIAPVSAEPSQKNFSREIFSREAFPEKYLGPAASWPHAAAVPQQPFMIFPTDLGGISKTFSKFARESVRRWAASLPLAISNLKMLHETAAPPLPILAVGALFLSNRKKVGTMMMN